ncbi:MAG TPA: hypothetical protein VGG14_16625 [Candidatus Sulfotelmatobacter sp.]|jgi:hypothetical protein
MKRKRKLSIYDLGRLENTPVNLPQGEAAPVGRLSDYRKQLAREEQEAAVKAKQARLNREERARIDELSSPATRAVAFFWALALQEIQTNISADVYDNGISLVPVDTFGVYETGDAGDAFDEFNSDLVNRGITLYRGGLVRLQLYLKARGVSLTFNNYQAALDRLASLNCFQQYELAGYLSLASSQTVVEQPREESEPRRALMDDLLALGDSREDERKAVDIGDQHWQTEWLEIAKDWVTSLQKFFGFSPTPEDLRRVNDWIQRNGQHHNRNDKRLYDAARRWMCASGYWNSATCLTATERFLLDFENLDTTRMTFDERRILSNKKQAAQEEDRAKFGHSQ